MFWFYWFNVSALPVSLTLLQKFGSIRADVIEQMRFKQRLRVIQTIEDTTKRNVVRIRPTLRVNVTKDVIGRSALFFILNILGQDYRHGDRLQHR